MLSGCAEGCSQKSVPGATGQSTAGSGGLGKCCDEKGRKPAIRTSECRRDRSVRVASWRRVVPGLILAKPSPPFALSPSGHRRASLLFIVQVGQSRTRFTSKTLRVGFNSPADAFLGFSQD
jgi:hypothetical protein